MKKAIGYSMLGFYANILLMPNLLDWWRLGGDVPLLFWSTFVAIGVFLIVHKRK